MFIFMSDTFFKVTSDSKDETSVIIHARNREQLVSLLTGQWGMSECIEHAPKSSYKYFVVVKREMLISIMNTRIANLAYPKFPDAVEKPLREFYDDIEDMTENYQLEIERKNKLKAPKIGEKGRPVRSGSPFLTKPIETDS